MRLPFLQVPQDVFPRARTLARILRIPEYQGIGLAVALDAWALEIAPEGDLSGLVDDPCPAEAIALAVGWEGDPAALLAGLVRVRLVSDVGGVVHVLTLAKYAEALAGPVKRSEQARRAAQIRWERNSDASSMPSASPRHASALPSDAGGMRSDANTQTQTQTKQTTTPLRPPSPSADGGARHVREAAANVVPLPPARRVRAEASALAVASASPPAVERDESGLLPFESGPPPEGEVDLPEGLKADFQAELGAVYRWDMRRDERAVNELLSAAGPLGVSEVRRRWRIGLRNQGFPRVRTLSDLVKRWNDCAQPAGGGGPAGPPRASDGLAPSKSDVCEGCGRAGQGARLGGGPDGDVWLGYACGCSGAFTAELEKGQPYTIAARWAKARRAGRAQ